MTKLAKEMLLLIIKEYGPEEVLNRLSDPLWFQAFGCVLGFDWHSSGLTTTVNGAVKEALSGLEHETGIFVAGGKGGKSRNTPDELLAHAKVLGSDTSGYVKISKLTAKVDSVAIQDGYQLYLHHMLFTKSGKWAVIQQGMNDENHYARRYHWLSDDVKSFVEEPHKAIAGEKKEAEVLNMTAKDSNDARVTTLVIAKEKPEKILKEAKILEKYDMPARHEIIREDINIKNLEKILLTTYENQPVDFSSLLLTKGFGPKSMRSLVMISELIYNKKPSYNDPITYSFAHGGKDGIPYPVDRQLYDSNIAFLKELVNSSKIEYSEKANIFKSLAKFEGEDKP
jgi:hypothetical protein